MFFLEEKYEPRYNCVKLCIEIEFLIYIFQIPWVIEMKINANG